MLSKKKWAVVGATPNTEKIAYKIVKKLRDCNYEVYCVNPNYDKIEDNICYKDIDSLPEVPDCIDFVVPSAATKDIVETLDPDKIKYLWFQPGSFDAETVCIAEEKGFQVVENGACVLVEMRKFLY